MNIEAAIIIEMETGEKIIVSMIMGQKFVGFCPRNNDKVTETKRINGVKFNKKLCAEMLGITIKSST